MLAEIANTPIREMSLREPARARRGASLLEVVAVMREMRRGAVLIEGEGGVVEGIFTEADLMARVDHSSQGWHSIAVADAMTAGPQTLSADTSIADALKLMHGGTFRHLPVIEASGRATGILSIRDILAHIVEFFPAEFINLPPDPDHEAKNQWGG